MDTKRYLELEDSESHIIIELLNDVRTKWLNENDTMLIDILENVLDKLQDRKNIIITGREYCLLVNLLNNKRIELTGEKENTVELEDLLLKVIDSPKQREMVYARDEAR